MGQMLGLARLKAAFAPQAKAASWAAPLMEWLKTHDYESYEDYLKTGSQKVWASFKACDLVSKAVNNTPFAIYRGDGTEPTQVPELQRILSFPNPLETFPELIGKTVFHLKLTGNAYWLKSEANIRGERPKEVYSLNPKRVRVKLDRNGELVGYTHRVGGRDTEFAREEVMHFRQTHPNNDFYGLGDIQAAEDLFSDFQNRQKWLKRFWKHGAAPSGLMTAGGEAGKMPPSQHEVDRAQSAWESKYAGLGNMAKTMFLAGHWKYEKIGMTAEEMQDIERLKVSVEQIFQVHGVPLSVAGVREAANYATAEIDDQRFRTWTVWPLAKLIQDTVNTDLVTGWGQNLRFRYDTAGLVDVALVVRNFGPLFDRGVLSVNELRQKAGLPPSNNPVMDQHFIVASHVPIDLSGVADLGRTEEAAQRAVQRFLDNKAKEQP